MNILPSKSVLTFIAAAFFTLNPFFAALADSPHHHSNHSAAQHNQPPCHQGQPNFNPGLSGDGTPIIKPRCHNNVPNPPPVVIPTPPQYDGMICTTQSDGHFFIYKTKDSSEILEVMDRSNSSFTHTPRAIQYLVNACVGGGHCSHNIECAKITHCLCVANVECRNVVAQAPLYVFTASSLVKYGNQEHRRTYTVRARNTEVGLQEVIRRCKEDSAFKTNPSHCEMTAHRRFPTMEEDEEDELAYERAIRGFRMGDSDMVRSPIRNEHGGHHQGSHQHINGQLTYYFHQAYSSRSLIKFDSSTPATRKSNSAPSWNPMMREAPGGGGAISGKRGTLRQSPNDPNLWTRE